MDEKLRSIIDFLSKVAGKMDYELNPDEKALHRTASYMAENERKTGRRFCPCKQHYPIDPRKDPVCPCPESKSEIARDGHCECHIFFSREAVKQAVKNPGLLATVTCPG